MRRDSFGLCGARCVTIPLATNRCRREAPFRASAYEVTSLRLGSRLAPGDDGERPDDDC